MPRSVSARAVKLNAEIVAKPMIAVVKVFMSAM